MYAERTQQYGSVAGVSRTSSELVIGQYGRVAGEMQSARIDEHYLVRLL